MRKEAAELLPQIERELASKKSKLKFSPELERRFEADTAPAMTRRFVYAGIIAVALSDSFLLSDYLSRPEILLDIFLVRLLLVTLPCAIFIYTVHRGVRADTRELMTILAIWLVSFATGLINQWTRSEFASYDIFIFVLITVASNVTLPMRFRTAVIASTGALIIMQLMVFEQPFISFEVKLLSFMIFTSGTIFTLFSRYQLDVAYRINYLNMLRSELQNRLVLSDNAELREISNTDALTGLANRRRFNTVFEELQKNLRGNPGAMTGLLMIDIDHFKAFNDHFGHLDGDRCLENVARIIVGAMRVETDLVARLGGEEFAVILPDIDIPELKRTAERIRRNVAEAKISHDGLGGRDFLTVSIGFTLTREDMHEDIESVLKRADEALYKAKNGGRNRFEGQFLKSVA